jgi:hypothetical protein
MPKSGISGAGAENQKNLLAEYYCFREYSEI